MRRHMWRCPGISSRCKGPSLPLSKISIRLLSSSSTCEDKKWDAFVSGLVNGVLIFHVPC